MRATAPRVLIPALAATALAVAALLCASTWGGAFLSDDWALVLRANQLLEQGQALPSLARAYSEAEGLQTGFYRPTGLVSWVVSALHAGYEPAGWQIGNFLLHVLCGWLLLRLVRRIADGPSGAAAAWLAAALFWLWPLAPEASVWPAARFDQLALAGVLVACERHLAARRWLDGARLASLLALAFALSSKEAAMLAPPLMVLVALMVAPPAAEGESRLRACARAVLVAVRDALPAFAVLAAVLLLRRHLFGQAMRVYEAHASTFSFDVFALPRRVAGMAPVLEGPFAAGAVWLVAAVLAVLAGGAWLAMRERRWLGSWLLPAAATGLTVVALAVHFDGSEPGGFGARMFYATGAWLALWMVLPFARREQAAAIVAVFILPVFAAALAVSTAPWREAGLAMRALLPKVVEVAATAHARGEHAVVLVPDLWQTTAFARNAQGGIMAGGIVPVNPHAGNVLAMLPPTAEVFAHVREHALVIGEGRPLRLYCFDALPWSGDVRLVEHGLAREPHDFEAWWAAWSREILASDCADDFPQLRAHPLPAAAAAGSPQPKNQ